MPDIYGTISPASDTPEVQSIDHITPVSGKLAPIAVYDPIKIDYNLNGESKGTKDSSLNDLDILMGAVDKSLVAQPWAKAEIFTQPIINTPYKFTSRYLDPTLGFDATDKDIETKYGDAQGGWAKIGNRLLKTGATAALSFAEGINTAVNLFSGSTDASNQGLTNATEMLNKLDQETLPNYQTTYQKEHPLGSFFNPFQFKSWVDNLGQITQNLGYTVGAMASAALLDIPIAAATEGLGEIPLIAAQSKKIFSSIGKLSRLVTGSAEEYNVYKSAIGSGENVLKALAQAANIKRGTNTVRFLNSSLLSAYGESMMEGNQGYVETKKALQSQYSDSYGNYTGNAETSAKIEDYAKANAQMRMKANMAFLSISNMFGLGSVLRPGAAAIRATEEALSKNVMVKLAENNINKFDLIVNKATGLKSLLKNGSRPLKLITENAKEGLEEGYQFGIEKGTQEYYTRKFNDTSNNDVNKLSESINNAFSQALTTTEGQQNILMGFVGGIVQAGGQGFIQSKQGILTGAALGEHIRKNLNEHTVTSLFNVARNEAVTAADIVREMQDAAKNGDIFTYKNLQHQQLFNLVDSGVKANKFDARIEQLEALKGMSKENFEVTFNLELNSQNKVTVDQYIDGIIEKAKSIKKHIDNVNVMFGSNPYSKTKDAVSHHAFEIYKSELALTASEQEDHLRRVKILKDNLSSALPAASYQPVIDLASERGITETLATFEKRVSDLKNTRELGKGNPELTKGMTEEINFLERKVKEINDAVTNERTYEKDFLGTVNSLHNYYGNGHSLYGDSNISRLDSVALFNKSYDINALQENTKRLQRYYNQLINKDGFKNLAEDLGRRIDAFSDRIRIDDKGKFKVLTDEELDNEGKVTEEAPLPEGAPIDTEHVTNVLAVKDQKEGEQKIDEGDKDLISKLMDDGEEAPEGEKTTAQKIKDGDIEITPEIKEAAKARLETEFAPKPEETPKEKTTGKNGTKAQAREAKLKEEAKAKGIHIADDIQTNDGATLDDMLDKDLEKAKTKATTTTPKAEKTPKPIKPKEEPATPQERLWSKMLTNPIKILNRLFSPNSKDPADIQYKNNMEALLITTNSPAEVASKIVNKIRAVITPSTKGKTANERVNMIYYEDSIKRTYDNLFRTGFGTDVTLYNGDTPIGIMHPPASLQFKRGDQYLTLDKLADAAEYHAVTKNDPKTFDRFKKEYSNYADAYDKLLEGYKGEQKDISNAAILQLFKPIISYGSVDYSTDATRSTSIKDLKYRGKGDAILSFPLQEVEGTNKYERTTKPTILNRDELSEEQITEILSYVADNIKNIHAQKARYIYLMHMPDGSLSNQSVIVARPINEDAPNLEKYLDQIKTSLKNADHESYFKLNAMLGEAIYIAHGVDTQLDDPKRTNIRFSIDRANNGLVLNVHNKALGITKRLTFLREDIVAAKDFNDFLRIVNRKIVETENKDRYFKALHVTLSPESFKSDLKNDDTITREEAEKGLAVSVTPRVFVNGSITMMPHASVTAEKTKTPPPAAKTTTTATTTTPIVTTGGGVSNINTTEHQAGTATPASTQAQQKQVINDIVNDNYKDIINQLKAKGIIETEC